MKKPRQTSRKAPVPASAKQPAPAAPPPESSRFELAVRGFWPRLCGLQGQDVHSHAHELVNLSVLLFVLSVAVAVGDMTRGCSGDLRARVVSARAMREGLDPYRYVWTPAMSERLADCFHIPAKFTRATLPPSVLAFYALTSGLSWTAIRWLYFGLDEILFLLGAILLARLRWHRTDLERGMVVALVLVAIGCSPIWRVHLDRGQYYIYPVFLLIVALSCLERRQLLWAGVAVAAAAFLRPTVAPFMLPFLIGRRWPMVVGAAAGLALCLGASLPVTGIAAWSTSREAIAASDRVFTYRCWTPANPDAYFVPPDLYLARPAPPPVVEGVRTPKYLWRPAISQSSSLLSVFDSLVYLADQVGAAIVPDPVLDQKLLRAFRVAYVVLALGVCAALVLWGRGLGNRVLFLVGLCLVFAAEYLTPSGRFLYGEVFQVLPLGLLGPLLFRPGLPRFWKGCGWFGAGWGLLSLLGRFLPGGWEAASLTVRFIPHGPLLWLNLLSWVGPYAALLFLGGATVYLWRQERRAPSPLVSEQERLNLD